LPSAIESCFIEERDRLVTEDLRNAQKNIKSISSTLERRIKEIREAVKDIDLKHASSEDNKVAIRPTGLKRPQNTVPDTVDSMAISLVEVLGEMWWKKEDVGPFMAYKKECSLETSGLSGYGLNLI